MENRKDSTGFATASLRPCNRRTRSRRSSWKTWWRDAGREKERLMLQQNSKLVARRRQEEVKRQRRLTSEGRGSRHRDDNLL